MVGDVTSLCSSLLLCFISQQQPFVETNLEAVFLSFLGSFPFSCWFVSFQFSRKQSIARPLVFNSCPGGIDIGRQLLGLNAAHWKMEFNRACPAFPGSQGQYSAIAANARTSDVIVLERSVVEQLGLEPQSCSAQRSGSEFNDP